MSESKSFPSQDLDANTEMAGRLARTEAELAANLALLKQARQEVTTLRDTLQVMQASRSWRITQPMRNVGQAGRLAARAVRKVVGLVRQKGLVRVLMAARREFLAGGVAALVGRVNRIDAPPPTDDLYTAWIERQAVLDAEARAVEARESGSASGNPQVRFSVVMPVYNTTEVFLRRAIDSVRHQVYPHWELCIADDASPQPHVRKILTEAASLDPRIKFVRRAVNGHICAATNSAIEIATGDFVALLDHDDELHPMALFWVARELARFPEADLVYSDEDKIGIDGKRESPYFKCDFNYELLLSHNMICHLGVYRRSLLQELGGFRLGFEGAQDYDLALRVFERAGPQRIRHIPKVLYHWRVHPESTASGADAKPYAQHAAWRAIQDHLDRAGLQGKPMSAPEARSMNRVQFSLPNPAPLVEIIIPTRDRADLLRMSVGTVLAKTSYPNFRITVVDNGSIEPQTHELFRSWEPEPRLKVLRDDSPFNFSRLNNVAAAASEAPYLCLLNNDIEVIDGDWLGELVSHACRPGVGCVGARLWYPNGTLQHGGVVLGIGGVAGHAHKGLPRGNPGYFSRAVLLQSYSAVTAACLLVRHDIYDQVQGLDEQLSVAFNDVDFCLRVRQAGYRNIWTPYAELIHHESLTRGHEDTPEKAARFGREVRFMMDRWGDALQHDPCYSPNLTLVHEDFRWA